MIQRKTGGARRALVRVCAAVAALAIVAVAAVFALFGHEIKTVTSLSKLNDYPLYSMTYDGDYGFDDFLKQGASNDGELIDFVVKRLMKGLPVTIDLPDLSCATFDAATPGGERLFARNFDLDYSPAVMVRTDPDDGYASISMVNLAFLGYSKDKLPDSLTSSAAALAAPYAPLDGMNEKGLAVGVLLIDTEPTNQDTGKVDITTTSAIRMLLDKCATVDEAVSMLKQYDMHSSAKSCYHFQIADATGKSAVVEYIDNEMSVVEQEGTYQAVTNFLLTPSANGFGSGQDRYQTIVDGLAAAQGRETEEGAMSLLGSAAQAPHKSATSNKTISTQWSVVYNLTRKTARVCMGGDYQTVQEFSLED